tara:strand:- start:2311 stop:2634 length:324 start_codon:yes stop_codon:yes gene_type:complete
MTLETKTEALMSLKPGAEFIWSENDSGDALYSKLQWVDTKQTKPTESEINAEVTRLANERTANQYQVKRRAVYPDIGDQLDDLYKKGAFSDDMAAKLKKVKDDNPKP